MQGAEFHPFDGRVFGQEAVGLPDIRDRNRLAIEPDPERCAQRSLGHCGLRYGLRRGLVRSWHGQMGKRRPCLAQFSIMMTMIATKRVATSRWRRSGWARRRGG